MLISRTTEEYLPWLLLRSIPGIGNVLGKRLILNFSSPDNIFDANESDLLEIRGMSRRIVSAIKNPQFRNPASMKMHRDELARIEKSGFRITVITDPDYPMLLSQIPDPPILLTLIGAIDNDAPHISIVGSRQATDYGMDSAASIAGDLASSGFSVVSGMAIGIDSAAHNGALQAGGRTVAVLGSGLGRIYPPENRSLFYRIADNGAVISEFKVDAAPESRNFPMRNRIIAGISSGTVVVEAAAKSGSLITARLAAEYNREVFAVPGNINSLKSAGTHALLKQGAKLVENYLDILDELNLVTESCIAAEKRGQGHGKESESQAEVEPGYDGDAGRFEVIERNLSCCPDSVINNPDTKIKAGNSLPEGFIPDRYHLSILDIVKKSPIHIDRIIELSGLDVGGITAALMDLELMGTIGRTPGKMFYKVEE